MNQNDRDFINALAQGIREEHKSTLEHSGVKGMKWGVRKTRNAIANISAKSANKKLSKIDKKVATKEIGRASCRERV